MPQERIQERIAEQVVDIPLPQIMEEMLFSSTYASTATAKNEGTASSSPALLRTAGRATRGFPACRANSPFGMGVHHELAQVEQSGRADHTRHTPRTRQPEPRQSSASTETASFTTGLAKTGLSRRRDRVDLQWYECDKSQSQAVRESVAVRESPPASIRAELPSNGSLKKSESHRQSQSTLSPHQMAHQRPAQRRGWLRTSRGIHT